MSHDEAAAITIINYTEFLRSVFSYSISNGEFSVCDLRQEQRDFDYAKHLNGPLWLVDFKANVRSESIKGHMTPPVVKLKVPHFAT